MSVILNPTGLAVRNDSAGNGNFGAPRGTRTHDGVDFVCLPGERVRSPISGRFARLSLPYSDNSSYLGAYLIGERVSVKLWYFEPDQRLIGQFVSQGDFIGVAQDVSLKYPGQGMTPHLHLKVERVDPTLLMV